jgi:hypothetical protein
MRYTKRARLALDIELAENRWLLAWRDQITCNVAAFNLVVQTRRTRRDGDVSALARLDQLRPELRGERREVRNRYRKAIGRLRRLRSGGGPGRPLTP